MIIFFYKYTLHKEKKDNKAKKKENINKII